MYYIYIILNFIKGWFGMNLKDINYYLPLNNIELTYKDIFFNNPNFEFEKTKFRCK